MNQVSVQPTIKLGGMVLDNLPKMEMVYGSELGGFHTDGQRLVITLRHFDDSRLAGDPRTKDAVQEHTVTLELGFDGNWELVTKAGNYSRSARPQDGGRHGEI